MVVRAGRTFPIPSVIFGSRASSPHRVVLRQHLSGPFAWGRVASDPVLPAGTRGQGSFARRPIRGLETSFSHLANATLLPRLRLPAPSVGAAVGTPINFIWLKLMGTVGTVWGCQSQPPKDTSFLRAKDPSYLLRAIVRRALALLPTSYLLRNGWKGRGGSTTRSGTPLSKTV